MNELIKTYPELFTTIISYCNPFDLIYIYQLNRTINVLINSRDLLTVLCSVWNIKLGCKMPEKTIFLRDRESMKNIYPTEINFKLFMIQYVAKYIPRSSLLLPMELLHISLKNDDLVAYTNLVKTIPNRMKNSYKELLYYHKAIKILTEYKDDDEYILDYGCGSEKPFDYDKNALEYSKEFMLIELIDTNSIIRLVPEISDIGTLWDKDIHLVSKYDRDDLLPYLNNNIIQHTLDGMSPKIVKYFIDNHFITLDKVYLRVVSKDIEFRNVVWQTLALIEDLLTQINIHDLIENSLRVLDTEMLDWLLSRYKSKYQAPYNQYIRSIRVILKKHGVIDGPIIKAAKDNNIGNNRINNGMEDCVIM
jgi:hypothetical protein